MREILFRGKTEKGEWVYGVPFLEEDRCYIIEDLFLCDEYACTGAENTTVIPETIGQYTGLIDKNGKKIFEGDIIKHHRTLFGADNTDIGTILWDENICKFYRTSKFDTIEKVEIWKDTAIYYEVIGNIHDNPELLKEKANER